MSTAKLSVADFTDVLGSEELTTSASLDFASTSKKAYGNILRHGNTTSYSQLTEFHRCPRKFQLMKQQVDSRLNLEGAEENLNFAFGHSVGAGIQSWMKDKNLDIAMFNAFMAWNAVFEDRDPKGCKSIWEANLAVEKFVPFANEALDDWDILILPSGRPAVEVNFSFHAERGWKHYGHMDLGLRNRRNGRIAVGECKTSKYKQAEEAFYANSAQGVSYATLLDAVYPGIVDYDVLYMVYSTTSREWQLLPFTKTVKHKAEWVKDILIDHAQIEMYERIRFYPKRGEACYEFNRRCQYFGECNLVGDDKFPLLPADAEAEEVDFVIRLEDIISSQKGNTGS
jgi:hypothetical protein